MTETSPNSTTGQSFIPSIQPAEPPRTEPTRIEAVVDSRAATAPAGSLPPSHVADQLARIEDKCARIEDKYARSEALLSRVEEKMEGAASRMGEAARQSDVAALRAEMRTLADRTKRLPGAGALVLTAVITAVLTVVLMIAVQRLNLQNLLPPPR